MPLLVLSHFTLRIGARGCERVPREDELALILLIYSEYQRVVCRILDGDSARGILRGTRDAFGDLTQRSVIRKKDHEVA
jgi:hypothetical protein